MDERIEAWTSAALNVLYALALAAMVLAAMPGAREPLAGAWRAQVYAWRHGRWLGSRSPAPPWTRQLAREDLPADNPRA